MATSKKRLGTGKPRPTLKGTLPEPRKPGGKAKMGRPPEPVPQDIADEVVEWISSGQTLRDYCRQPGKPARRTIDDWRAKDDNFSARFARARDDGFDVIAEECMAIADDGENDWMVREGKDGESGWQVNGEHIQRTKVRIETRLKLLAKWDPRRYGDRIAHVGDATADPIKVESSDRPLTTQEIAEQMRQATALIDEVLAQRDKSK